MSDLTFTIDDKEVIKKMSDLTKGVKDFKQPLNEAGDKLLSYYGDDVFASQGALIGGTQWKKLSPATLKARAYGQGHYAKPAIATNMILVWTGTLKKGFRKAVTSTKLVIDNTVEYFKYNQKTRKMLDINAKVIEIAIKSIYEYIEKLTK